MSDPGYDFTRKSFHTLSVLACPRKAYLAQILQIKRRKPETGWSGPFAAGTVFHTLLEVRYSPEKYLTEGNPEAGLLGTEGNPILRTAEEVYDYYADVLGYDESAIEKAKTGYDRYMKAYGNSDSVLGEIVGRPEMDLAGDLAQLPGLDTPRKRSGKRIQYQAQYDAVMRTREGVVAVEHKLLSTWRADHVEYYARSGQIRGQAAVWNASPNIVARYGRMTGVLINIAFKQGKNKVLRQYLPVSNEAQLAYAAAVDRRLTVLETKYRQYRDGKARPGDVWPQDGMVNNLCVPLDWACDYLPICETGWAKKELYQITEAGASRAEHDRLIRLEEGISVR